MTRLSAAMVRMLARVPDPPHTRSFTPSDLRTRGALKARGLVADRYPGWFQRTPFGRETAERLRRDEK